MHRPQLSGCVEEVLYSIIDYIISQLAPIFLELLDSRNNNNQLLSNARSTYLLGDAPL